MIGPKLSRSVLQIAQLNKIYRCVKDTKTTNLKKLKKTFKKGLTKRDESGIIYKLSRRAQRKAVSEVIEN